MRRRSQDDASFVTGPVCGRPAECRTGTSTDGFVKLVVGTIGSFSAFISSAISLAS